MTQDKSGDPLSSDELGRYARHIVLPEVGGAGQQKLKRARILVIGAGGIGSPVVLYLAAAGVGTIGIADDDTVSLSNLQRQVLHGTADIGRAKLDSAAERVAALNPHVAMSPHGVRIDAANGAAIVAAYDLVIDGSDNFATRYALADLCAAAERPLVTAAVNRFNGSLTTLMPYATNADGNALPGYRDLFPEAPPAGLVPSCAEAGILGVVTGILGTLAAAEAIKLVCGIGEPLLGRLLLVDVLQMRFETIRYRRSKAAPARD
ncbi:thiamine biosynthesis protein ThiF [Aureimonas sp. SA4125]|uniref:molybdopterin-synthase adenylyltransferase MoeB n=1 Tax=Aureimonas sp. SA4125 TaxID=2826993 RepID=UPI001CC336FF|nr:molybdopterin-synthase adenylyltransferase MoeB [Aureimonas sp. SA4125]BDA82462.1 thiamine biosynthesis protein ThiF [Aureimonas sp. SA4125]